MKNDSKMIKLIAIVLLVTIVALILVSGTFARYTSTTSGTAKAYVATWYVTLNGDKLEDATFDVFGTVYDSNGGTENDVSQTAGTTIAPGTSGEFTLSIVNNSDVTASISLTSTKATGCADVPLEFSTDKTATTWETDIADVLDVTKTLSAGGSYEPTIYWRWAYEGTSDGADAKDTTLGEASYTALQSGTRTSYNVTVSVTATQAD